MHISERTIGDVVIVDVSGKITLGDGGDVALKDKIRSLVQQGQKKVLLNLGDVSYMDSAAAGDSPCSTSSANSSALCPCGLTPLSVPNAIFTPAPTARLKAEDRPSSA